MIAGHLKIVYLQQTPFGGLESVYQLGGRRTLYIAADDILREAPGDTYPPAWEAALFIVSKMSQPNAEGVAYAAPYVLSADWVGIPLAAEWASHGHLRPLAT